MRTLIQVGGSIVGIVAGGAVGGLIGWGLGDFGGRSDPENVWFLSLIVGAAVGLAAAMTLILRDAGRRTWGVSILVGTMSSIVIAGAFIAFVAWQRRP